MEKQKTPQRLQSLDALRGFDMFFIMGGATLIAAIAAFWPNDFTQWLAAQMDHIPSSFPCISVALPSTRTRCPSVRAAVRRR